MPLTSISHYRLEKKLGSGAIGDIYLAYDEQSGRRVAVKLLRSPQPGTSITNSFFEKARALSSFTHPNMTTIFEAGEFSGRPFVVLEYTEGESLAQKIAAGPLPMREVIKIATELAIGLSALHQENIVHRDLNPSNVLIDRTGVVKITDFSISSVGSAQALAYKPPEELQGHADIRSDIFSFGAILFAMVTGKAPSGRHVEGTLLADIDETRTAVPRFLEAIIEKSLKPAPEERFESVNDILEELVRKLPDTERVRGRTVSAFPNTLAFPMPVPTATTLIDHRLGKLDDSLRRLVSSLKLGEKKRLKTLAVSMIAITFLIALTGFIFLSGTVLGFAMAFGGSLLSYECYILARVSN